jgi:hypothetical protein
VTTAGSLNDEIRAAADGLAPLGKSLTAGSEAGTWMTPAGRPEAGTCDQQPGFELTAVLRSSSALTAHLDVMTC